MQRYHINSCKPASLVVVESKPEEGPVDVELASALEAIVILLHARPRSRFSLTYSVLIVSVSAVDK